MTNITIILNEVEKRTEQAQEILNVVEKGYLQTALENALSYDNGKFTIYDSEKVCGMDALSGVSYVVTKKALCSRPWLPLDLQEQARYRKITRDIVYQGRGIDDWRNEVSLCILESFAVGKPDHAIPNAFSIFDAKLENGNFEARNTTLKGSKTTDKDFVLAVEDLCSLNPKGLKTLEDVWGTKTHSPIFDREFASAVDTLFNAVKEQHKFATAQRWDAFKYYVLNFPNKEIADLLAISKQRSSKLNRTTIEWIFDGVKYIPDTDKKALEKWGLKL